MSSIFYVVSDTWMGRAMHVCDSTNEAERNQYLEVLRAHGYDEESDQNDVKPEQFRAWPAVTFPEHLEFAEAFDWISTINPARHQRRRFDGHNLARSG